ncbi:MAG: glycosyltransferase family 4 protein [Desulfuromonadaceae bacterium]|nr:glycosyltransferase family 4 protein [Desulfuromonadaceae bacterium]
MKIVQLLPELNEGGVERGVVELSRELVKLGHESIVISNGGKQAKQIALDGGKHIQLDLCSKNLLTAPIRILKLRRCLRELNPDIIHARSRVPAWLAWLANKTLRIEFVTTVHGFNSVNPYSRVMTFGDRVICVSGAIKTYIQQHYGVPDDIIYVIPRGIDLDTFNPDNLDDEFKQSFKAEYNLAGRFVVTSVGRITQLKDYETLIRAIDSLRTEFPEILGLIVGGVHEDKMNYFQSLQKLISSLGLKENILFTGSQAKVAEIYSLSDVVVSSSKKPESFGRSAAEALAMNVPVVATAHGGMLDIVIEGETGRLFQTGDSVGLADCIISLRDHRLSGLRAFVEDNFTLAGMVAQTLQVYLDLQKEYQDG